MVPRITSLLAALATVSVACGDSAPSITTPAYESFRSQPTACGADAPAPARERRYDAPEDLGLTGNVIVDITTSCGTITLELLPQIAPITVNSFVFLAEQGYFDGTVIHRVLPGFVIQAGDPTATGTGGPGYRLPDELPPPGFTYAIGMVAMANAGPNTSGSQFFLVIGDTQLQPNFTVFGAVIDGADAINRIAAVPRGTSPGNPEPSRPLETIYIESASVTR
jgi:cyclophilin family peptidyl-prolyl cis-trans isomerase